MDIPIYLPTKKVFVQTLYFEKIWLEDTLPSYNLDICPKFRSFFFIGPSPKGRFQKKKNIGKFQ